MKIRQIIFRSGTKGSSDGLIIEPSNVTVIVGPNNSGKSQTLREIDDWLHGFDKEMKVLSKISLSYPSGFDDLESWVRSLAIVTDSSPTRVKLYKPSINREPREHSLNIANWLKSKFSSKSDPNVERELRSMTTSWATYRLDATDRFALTKHLPKGDLVEPSTHHIGELFREEHKRRVVRRLCAEAFSGLYYAIDPLSEEFRIRMGTRAPTENEEMTMNQTARMYHSQASLIDDLGDGVRVYTGLISALVSLDWRYITIEDPEAFLHPPIARKLGSDIARLASERDAQVFVSTHSSDFLLGCLDVMNSITIVRLTYDHETKNASAHSLSRSQTEMLVQHPLLKSTMVFDGMFHVATVVTEADSDRVFYEEINRRLVRIGSGVESCLFLNANGRDTIDVIFGTLRNLGIKSACIVDIDLLFDGGPKWKELLKTCEFDTDEILSFEEFQKKLVRELLGEQSAEKSKEVRTKFKKKGLALLESEFRAEAEEILSQLEGRGLFFVPNGEMESWFENLKIDGHGNKWLQNCFEKIGINENSKNYLKPELGDVWDFMIRISNWIKGIKTEAISFESSLLDLSDYELDLAKIFTEPESQTLEFKSSLLWDYNRNVRSEQLKLLAVICIAGFLNSGGGVLIIGVSDDRKILGIDKDISTLKDSSLDQFHLYFLSILRELLEERYIPLIETRYEIYQEHQIMAVIVSPSPNPVFINERGRINFYVRQGIRTYNLDGKELSDYLKRRGFLDYQ